MANRTSTRSPPSQAGLSDVQARAIIETAKRSFCENVLGEVIVQEHGPTHALQTMTQNLCHKIIEAILHVASAVPLPRDPEDPTNDEKAAFLSTLSAIAPILQVSNVTSICQSKGWTSGKWVSFDDYMGQAFKLIRCALQLRTLSPNLMKKMAWERRADLKYEAHFSDEDGRRNVPDLDACCEMIEDEYKDGTWNGGAGKELWNIRMVGDVNALLAFFAGLYFIFTALEEWQ